MAPLLNIDIKSLNDIEQPSDQKTESVSDLPGELLERKIDLVMSNTPAGALISSLAAMLLVVLFAHRTDALVLAGWAACFAFGTGLRLLLHSRYKASAEKANPAWLDRYALSMGVLGIVWGSAVVMMAQSGAQIEFMLIAVWALGLTATSLVAFAVTPRVFFAFSIPTLVPGFIVAIASDDPFNVTLGVGICMFFAFMSICAIRTSRFIETGLQLEIEKELLAVDLDVEKRQVEELNQILRADILEREQTETELRKAKDEAERLAEKLTLISALDGLTEIANRRHLDEALEREWARAARDKTPLSLILMDIDHFKPYNDRYGHQAGDQCLRVVAHILEGFCRRGGDLAARYGGEEFALLLPSTEIQSAINIAERIRAGLTDTKIEHHASPISEFVTASFGVTTIIPQKEASHATLVETADNALYRAKDAGRNRVESGAPVSIIGKAAP